MKTDFMREKYDSFQKCDFLSIYVKGYDIRIFIKIGSHTNTTL